jgi:hypothetical protein
VTIPSEVFDFLMGTGALDGYYFGDSRPDMRGAFWWRTVIRESLTRTPATEALSVEGEVRALALVLAAAHDHASDGPTKAVTAIKAGVGFCQEYWDHLAIAAIRARPSPAPVAAQGEVAEMLQGLLRDMEEATAGGMSWIDHTDVLHFKAQAKARLAALATKDADDAQ